MSDHRLEINKSVQFNALLFGVVVFAWGFSWYGIRSQLGLVAPEVSAFWRFFFAATLLLGLLALSGRLKRASLRDHRWFAIMGLCLFSGNYLMYYQAELSVSSGVVSVVFSVSTVINGILLRIFLGKKWSPRNLLGSAMGVIGVTMMFADQVSFATTQTGVVWGLCETLFGTLLFCLGNFATKRVTSGAIDLPNAVGRGMAWGSVVLAVFCVTRRHIDLPPISAEYLTGLIYLIVVASVVAFLAYLKLAENIGPERAAYSTVLAPVLALAVSTVLEDYSWSAWAVIGVPLILLGNVVIFAPRRS